MRLARKDRHYIDINNDVHYHPAMKLTFAMLQAIPLLNGSSQ